MKGIEKFIVIGAIALGFIAGVNGTLMITAPETWYWLVPGVPDRGPFNQHFIRDIGIIYLLSGAAYIYGALHASSRVLLWVVPTAWFVAHGIFHIWEVLVGICGPASLLEDFGGVYLTAMIGVLLIFLERRQRSKAENV